MRDFTAITIMLFSKKEVNLVELATGPKSTVNWSIRRHILPGVGCFFIVSKHYV